MKKNKLKLMSLLLIAAAIAGISGCDENGGILIPSGSSNLTVSVKADDNITDANLVITEAKALITEVEFEKASNSKSERLLQGPFVVNFNLGGALTTLGTQYIIRDIYTKAKFKIHKPEDNESVPDPEFKEGTGESQRFSFIVKGTYNGNSFIYKSKNSSNIVINFNAAENINIKQANVTIAFNKLKWFKNGSIDLNPNDAQFEGLINDNIKNSFIRVFRDDNKDGAPDQ